MKHSSYTAADFAHSPLMFYFETTLACDLVCKHCRAEAQEEADSGELSTEQAKALIAQVASFPRKPTLVFTGGDPLKRHDLFELIEYAVELGLGPALTPSATPLATLEAFKRVKEAGITHLGVSLDGATAETHDSFRGFEGSFEKTLEMLENARSLDFRVQVNTTICKRNLPEFDAIAELLADKHVAMWASFFLIPVGRGVELERIEPQQYEEVFEKLWKLSQTAPFSVKTTEAPHYRRFVLQQGGDPLAGPKGENKDNAAMRRGHRAPLGVTDGRGIMFVNHRGEIYPAGFLPLQCGKFPENAVVEAYQSHPTFLAMRDVDKFRGRCGYCEFRGVCGGSRSRAYALTGDAMETDPDCIYQPQRGGE